MSAEDRHDATLAVCIVAGVLACVLFVRSVQAAPPVYEGTGAYQIACGGAYHTVLCRIMDTRTGKLVDVIREDE